MKIKKPMPLAKIPQSVRGRKRKDKYDGCIISALRTRSDKIRTRRVGLVLYAWHEVDILPKNRKK